MTKDQLEGAIEWANTWSGRSTLVLAAGILGEYVVLPFLDDKKRWYMGAKVFFAVLVVAGIVGEYTFSGQIAQKAAELQRISDAELATATNKAGDAIEKAGKANADAAAANERASKFQAEIEKSRAEAADARQMTAKEQLERVKLEALVSPRRIAPEDQARIRDALKGFSRRSVTVSSNGLDAEAAVLGAQIIASLPFTFTVRDDRAQRISSGGFDIGIHIRGPESEQDLVVALADALQSIGKLQTWINSPLPTAGATMSGNAAMRGNAALSGGGGRPGPGGPTAPGSPVWIEVGVKPVEVVNGLR